MCAVEFVAQGSDAFNSHLIGWQQKSQDSMTRLLKIQVLFGHRRHVLLDVNRIVFIVSLQMPIQANINYSRLWYVIRLQLIY